MAASGGKEKRKRRGHAVAGAATHRPPKGTRRAAERTVQAAQVDDGDDTSLVAPLGVNVEVEEDAEPEVIFEEPSHSDDGAIIDDAEGAPSRRRR